MLPLSSSKSNRPDFRTPYTKLYYIILYYDILYSTILYHYILYSTILYYTILFFPILYYTILYMEEPKLETTALLLESAASWLCGKGLGFRVFWV